MKKVLLSLVVVPFTLMANSAYSDKICLRVNRAKLSKRQITTGSCPRGFLEVVDTSTLTGPQGAAGLQGATGPQGSAGADGALKIWGDGSDGDLVAANSTTIDTTKQYRNVTINAGTTAFIRHGATLRCTGILTINGELLPFYAGNGGFIAAGFDAATYLPSLSLPQLGIALSAPLTPECSTSSGAASGGSGGASGGLEVARTITKAGLGIFGGNGSGSITGSGGQGGASIAIYCKTGIVVATGGVISNEGGPGVNGGGGAGGGIVILATNGTVSNAGNISVRGGAGGDSTANSCAGAGGGGGLVHFIGRTVNNTGTVSTDAGSFGSSPVTPSTTIRCGGGGGGASYGGGGTGLTAASGTGTCNTGGAADNGGVITTTVASGSVEGLLL